MSRRVDGGPTPVTKRKQKSIKRRTYGVVHGLALCKTCGWETQSYKNAQALAARHAAAYGHLVEGEIGIAFSYEGEGADPR